MTNSLKAALTTRLTRTNWKPSPISSRAKTTFSAKSSPTAPCHNASGVHREYDARPQCQAQPGRLAHVAASPLRLRRAKRRDAFFASDPYDGAVGARFIAPAPCPAQSSVFPPPSGGVWAVRYVWTVRGAAPPLGAAREKGVVPRLMRRCICNRPGRDESRPYLLRRIHRAPFSTPPLYITH